MRNIEPKKENSMMHGEVGLEKSPTKEIYPTIRLEHEFFPETKKWEVGKEYKVTLKLKMIGLSIARYQNNSEFDIRGFDYGNSSEKKDDEYKEEK